MNRTEERLIDVISILTRGGDTLAVAALRLRKIGIDSDKVDSAVKEYQRRIAKSWIAQSSNT